MDIDHQASKSKYQVLVDTPTIAASRSFLVLLRHGQAPSSRELLRSLDQLAMTYHQTPNGDPSDSNVKPPRSDYKARHANLAKRFPSYGYYAVADTTKPAGEGAMVADAIDDLADIVADLEEVIWRFENLDADDAHWHFRFLFDIHWGMHLRELSLYLHTYALLASDKN